jgi:pathogenesis-related protein 1
MKRIVCALAAVVACGGEIEDNLARDAATNGSSDAQIPGGVGEPAALAGITLYHNEVRAAVDTSGIAAGPLPPMQWDSALAAHAAAWTEMCIDADANGLVDHSANAYRTNMVGYTTIGENVFGTPGTPTPRDAVQTWAAEKANFTYPTTCTATCGHYTQIVSRSSIHLGCALYPCSGLQYGGTVLCMYAPAGSGGAPY